jgi:hypothetical protein
MMNDRFSGELRRHLLATADERPAGDALASIIDRVAVTDQRPSVVARLTWFPRRMSLFPTTAVRFALIAAMLLIAIVAAAVVAGPGAAPSSGGAFGGTVRYTLDGAPATTTIDAVADGTSLSGTAVTMVSAGTHTVRVGCAAHDGGSWILGGTVQDTTVPGEFVGAWSAVIVKDGTPQQIGIWLSGDLADASDCDAWVASIKPAEIDAENFSPVESGSLVPPPVTP